MVELEETLEPLHELEVVLIFAANQELDRDFFGDTDFAEAVLNNLQEDRLRWGKARRAGSWELEIFVGGCLTDISVFVRPGMVV